MTDTNCTNNPAPELTIADLRRCTELIASMPPPLVGAAVSPSAHAQLKREAKPAPAGALAGFYGTPIIVDSRLKGEAVEVYYCPEKWEARCREQNDYDLQHAS
jgi:hypothetical protein